jgi:hypothetical protein
VAKPKTRRKPRKSVIDLPELSWQLLLARDMMPVAMLASSADPNALRLDVLAIGTDLLPVLVRSVRPEERFAALLALLLDDRVADLCASGAVVEVHTWTPQADGVHLVEVLVVDGADFAGERDGWAVVLDNCGHGEV